MKTRTVPHFSPTVSPRQAENTRSMARAGCGEDKNESAGNRTLTNCLEGNYANHYTTDPCAFKRANVSYINPLSFAHNSFAPCGSSLVAVTNKKSSRAIS